jgi:hypothetical protein
MITINATGDTTLHTAGKYCPEDILVKIPPSAPATELVTETAACNIVGQCYATNAGSYSAYSTSTCYAGANTSNYYAYIMQLKTPVFKGTSKSIKFSLNIKSQYHANISLNYALATSDANKDSYKKTYATVTDANQIASGILTMNGMSTSTYGDWIIDVSTAQLKSETRYYLFLWGTSNATLTSVNNIDEQKHSITVEYEYEKVISGGESESCEVSLEISSMVPLPDTPTIYYVSPDMTLEHFKFSPGGGDIIAIAKNSIVYLEGWSNGSYASEGASPINSQTTIVAYFISGDCTLTYME